MFVLGRKLSPNMVNDVVRYVRDSRQKLFPVTTEGRGDRAAPL